MKFWASLMTDKMEERSSERPRAEMFGGALCRRHRHRHLNSPRLPKCYEYALKCMTRMLKMLRNHADTQVALRG